MKVPKQTFATFTKEGVSRKYYTSFRIHIQRNATREGSAAKRPLLWNRYWNLNIKTIVKVNKKTYKY